MRYTPTAGMPSLRAAVAEHLARTRGGEWGVDEITIFHSAKHALSAAFLTLIEDGDEVLLPLPAWTSYFDLIRVTGAAPVPVPSPVDEGGFRLDLDALRDAVTPRTRMIVLNSPNNPSGTVYDAAEVEGAVALALERDLVVLSDEIYRRLVYDVPAPASPASVGPDARGRTVVVDGASKAFAMTGYRIGFLAGPASIAAATAKLGSQTNGSPNTIAQAAYEVALREEPPEVEEMRRAFAARRTLLSGGLRELGLPTPEPRGAFYAFPDVSAHLDERGSVGFCEDLLEEQRLALVPGAAFGVDTHVRLSYATDNASIEEALRRLGAFLGQRAASIR